MVMSLQDYSAAHLPNDLVETKYSPLYMGSQALYEQAESGTGFFDPNNLLKLSGDSLAELAEVFEADVFPQLDKDITLYAARYLAADGDAVGAAAYTERFADYKGTLAMGLMDERFVVAGLPAGDVEDAIRGSIDDFKARVESSLGNTLEMQGRISELSQQIATRGVEGLGYHQDEIDALPETGKSLLREDVQALLEASETPENADELRALEQLLDDKIAPLPVEEAFNQAAPTAPGLSPSPMVV